MTLAVLHASTGNALDPADAARLAGDLDAALRAAGAAEVEHLDGQARSAGCGELARRAQDANEPLLICADNLVAHPSLLWMLATEPAGRSTALVVADPAGDLREERGGWSPPTDGTGTARYLGALCVAPGRPAVAGQGGRPARPAAGAARGRPGAGRHPGAAAARRAGAHRRRSWCGPGRGRRGGRGRGAPAARRQGEGRLLHDVRGEQLVAGGHPGRGPARAVADRRSPGSRCCSRWPPRSRSGRRPGPR